MSFIDLEFMGIESPDIMADSIDTKQMLVTFKARIKAENHLWYDGGSE